MNPSNPSADANDAGDDAVEAVRLLIALRQPASPRAAEVRARLATSSDPRERASHARLRAMVVAALAEALLPGDRPLVRWLLGQETADLEAEGHGASEALYTLVAVLARFGQAEDALLLWGAHAATPETRAGVDVEQLGRLGVDAVRRYLRGALAVPGAAEALAWLEEGATAGAFADLPEYFRWSDEQFGVHISGPT